MAIVDVQKLVRNSALTVKTFTSAMTTAGHAFLSSGISFMAQVSTLASTMTTDDANLYVPFKSGDKLGFVVGWGATNIVAATTSVSLVLKAGSGERVSWRRDIGDYTLTMANGNTSGPLVRQWIIGPFEDAIYGITNTGSTATYGVAVGQKYAHLQIRTGANSTLSATGSASSGTHLMASILPFQWPEVDFDT